MPKTKPVSGFCAYCARPTRRFDHRRGLYVCSKIVSAQRQANGLSGKLPLVVTTCTKHAKEQRWTILK